MSRSAIGQTFVQRVANAPHIPLFIVTPLSPSRRSLGDSPHRYLMMRRVARARQLLLTSDLGLSQIASDCGLADQAHFSRLFRRFLGCSPGAWRRENAGCEALRVISPSGTRGRSSPTVFCAAAPA
jgi:hypothetical protein